MSFLLHSRLPDYPGSWNLFANEHNFWNKLCLSNPPFLTLLEILSLSWLFALPLKCQLVHNGPSLWNCIIVTLILSWRSFLCLSLF